MAQHLASFGHRRIAYVGDTRSPAMRLRLDGSVEGLHAAGQQPTVALLGFDDLDLSADLDPALTVIAQDPRGVGTTAATMVFEQLSGGAAATRRVQMEPVLIPRGSGEIPAARR